MAIFPRPVSPRRAIVDLRDYVMQGRRHKFLFLALSLAATWAIVWAFVIDGRTGIKPGPQIIYIQSWAGNRSDVDIIEQQRADLIAHEKALARKQKQFRKVADQLGIDWRKDAQVQAERERKAVASVMARLDKAEADARAKQAGAGGGTGAAR